MKQSFRLFVFVVSCVFFSGCASPPSGQQDPHKPDAKPLDAVTKPSALPPVRPSDAVLDEPLSSERKLAIAVSSFETGAYSTAMKQLLPLTKDSSLSAPDRLKAIKFLAFSQCLTRAIIACQKTFESAFRLDSDFDLAPAEQGHPLWKNQFQRARQNVKAK